MKVTYNWLKDFAEIKVLPKVLAEKLTMAGIEVTSLEEKGGDFVFEMEITSNRPDCLSVMGVAREVAAITNCKLKTSWVMGHGSWVKKARRTTHDAQQISIKIEDKKDCPLYTARIIRNVQVGPSPDWLKRRLELVGCRSINNIVDITNYIMFTCGEPLHAFDLNRLSDNAIIVRGAKNGEMITTIDDEQRLLSLDILVIADKEKPIAIAGIMGGKDTEVTEGTKNILLEAAVFNPLIVRRGRRYLGLESESAYRFERGIDLEIVKIASWQTAELIHKIAGGECVLFKDVGLTKIKKRKIILTMSAPSEILGINITRAKIKNILNKLGFKLTSKSHHKNSLNIEVPSYRQDVNGEIDLIEEIARIYGYEHIPRTLPGMSPQITKSNTRDTISLIKNILLGLGLNEVITYSLINQDLLKDLEIRAAIEILNPLTKEQEILRPTVIPQFLKCLSLNLNQKQSRINIFEIANVFLATLGRPPHQRLWCGGRPQEKLVLSIAFVQDLNQQERGFLHLKGILEVLFERLCIKDYNFKLRDNTWQVTVDLAGENIGWMARLQRDILERFKIKNKDVFVAELFLDKLASSANFKKKFSTLPMYPGISKDVSLMLKDDIPAKDILEAIREKNIPLLRDLKLVDYYRGKQIPAGFKGLTISCQYRLDERTLTEAETEALHSQILAMLADKFGAKIRS